MGSASAGKSTDLSAEIGGLAVLNSSEEEVIVQRGEPQHRGAIQLKGGEVVLALNTRLSSKKCNL
ncbi:hypothetical protein EBB07_05430 [Paenibacillaceae bacterium]|nr:hypothetical protein EBB07_05430 [Paenibacillaceae bacterium]